MIEITDLADRLPDEWKPKSDAQRAVLDSPADLLLAGGAAGGGKSELMLVDALEMYDLRNYHAIIFRRTFPELQQLMDRSKVLFQGLGGTWNQADKIWRWPWGATLEFKYLEHDDDIYKRQGFEYTYVAFDESTHFMEKQIRYIINTRMRSKEGYRLKARLATNPGNRGADFHKKVFIGPKCLHCLIKEQVKVWPTKSRVPYRLYNNATWMDNVPIGRTTMFIPFKVTDHDIFGKDGGTYAQSLRGMSTAYMLALLEGCWDAFEGQFFDCFSHQANVFSDRAAIGEKSWWPYWVGIDYGFSMTHATVAYLNTMSPDGHVYTLEEYITHRTKAVDVAKTIQALWGGYEPKAWYLSPDAFRHDGTSDFSRAEMMSQETGIGFDEAYNERVSGAMLMYQLLSQFKWSISTDCPLLIDSLPSRQHGEDSHSEDVAKTESDADDCYDASRYSIASHINPGKRPQLEILNEQITSTDPTSAMIQYQVAMSKLNHHNLPIVYKGRSRSR